MRNPMIERGIKTESNVLYKEYSRSILGYRIMIYNSAYFFINSIHTEKIKNKTLATLELFSGKYGEYGFILLFNDFELYLCDEYKYNHIINTYIYKPINETNVIDFPLSKQLKLIQQLKEC